MKIKNVFIFGVVGLCCAAVYANESKTIDISGAAGYYDEKIIQPNIRTECKELGAQLSESTKKNLESDGWTVNQDAALDTAKEGLRLKLLITNATSTGNAFTGHHKSVSIEASLYKDGKLVDQYIANRDSGGGFGAGFKGSCTVLARCVTTLGSDVAKWLKKQNL